MVVDQDCSCFLDPEPAPDSVVKSTSGTLGMSNDHGWICQAKGGLAMGECRELKGRKYERCFCKTKGARYHVNRLTNIQTVDEP